MAANYVTVTPALAELISSLPQDEVPFKLRCAICSKLAVNAFKTPCCEQMICENCKTTLPSTCPVCEHTPVSVDDCKPNNKLRMTTRAFLKTAEKKRDSSQAKEATPATPITPIDAKPSATPAPPPTEEASTEPATAAVQEGGQGADVTGPANEEAGTDAPEEGKGTSPVADGENTLPADGQLSGETENKDTQDEATGEPNEEKVNSEAAPEEAGEGVEGTAVDSQQKPGFANGFGFNGMNVPNMPFAGGDFSQMSQMQMMMAMQNGMAPNGFGFNMMGMPGMGMDPSMMNNMYQMNNGFGAPGMDMSMMNGGMGGFNGNGGSEENWNGPQSWNNGQNNYNHPSAPGMGNGDYGNFNSGFHTGFNQGNFGPQNNQFNDFRGGRGYFRGRGRGRGYGNYGRGGFGYGQQGNYQGQNQNYMNQQQHQYGSNMTGQPANVPQSGGSQNGLDASSGNGEGDKNVDEYGRVLRRETTQDDGQDAQKTKSIDGANADHDKDTKEDTNGVQSTVDGSGLQPISVIETVEMDPEGNTHGGNVVSLSMRHNGPAFGNQQRGGSFGGMPPPAVPVPDVPLNAPTGPKAMRQGLPNTSLLHLRAKGYSIPGDEPTSINTNGVQSPSVQSGYGSMNTPLDDDRERDRRRSRSNSMASTVKRRETGERERERSRSRSRTGRDRSDRHRDRDRRGTETRSNSRSRSREHRDRKRKHRSDEDVDERDYEKDKDRRHRHRSSKKYYDDEEPRSSREDKYGDRSRSASPASRKSSRREKRRERERDEEEERDHKHKSSHSHRHRDSRSEREREREGKDRDRKRERGDRDKDRERDRDRDRDRDRERERDKDKDKERERRRSKHSTVEPPTPTEPSADRGSDVKEFNPPTGPRGSISKNYSIFNAPKPTQPVKGASLSRPSSSSSAIPKGPRAATLTKDPHAAEREARNRERLLKETQRLAGMGGGGGLKRRSGGDEGGDSGRSSRKKRRGGEVLDDEDTLKRAEAEREGSRWG